MKKNPLKRQLHILLICLLVLLPAVPAFATETPLLVQNTVYLEKNDTYTLKPNGLSPQALTWSSSDPKVATVTGGVVRALKPGYTRITATDTNDKTRSCTCPIVVKPAQVTGLTQTKTENRKLSLSWDKTDCSGYHVYWRKKGETSFLQAPDPSENRTVLKDLSPETCYEIRVAAYVDTPDGKTDGTLSALCTLFTSPEIKGKTKIKKFKQGKLSFYHGQKIRFYTVKWKKVKGADSYEIYSKVRKKKPQLIATAKKTSATIYAAVGYTYKIYVVPCRTKNGITARGKKSPVRKFVSR